MAIRIITFLIILGCIQTTNAQLPEATQNSYVRQIGEVKDYPSIWGRKLIQGSDGFIWWETLGGLCRWDGKRIHSYIEAPYDTLGPSLSYAAGIVEDKEGDLWIGSMDSGLERFSKETETFHQIAGSHIAKDISCLKFDKNGRLWIGTSKGLFSYSPDKSNFDYHLNQDSAFNNQGHEISIHSLEFDTTGLLWIASSAGLYYYDEKDQLIKHLQLSVPFETRNNRMDFVWDLSVDEHGIIWIFLGLAELVRFNPYSNEIELIWPVDNTHSNYISPGGAVHVDKDGMVWFGGGAGLHMYDPYSGKAEEKQPGTFPAISEIIEDSDGNILMRNWTGNWILEKRRSSLMQTSMSTFGFSYIISDILRDDQNIWIASRFNGISRYEINQDTVHEYFKQLHGIGDNVLFYRIFKDNLGKIWVMSSEHLYLYDPDKNDFNIVPIPSGLLTMDSEGIFWIAREDRLISLHPETMDTIPFLLKDSLNINTLNDIYGFVKDSSGYFWLGHQSSGLYRIDNANGEVSEYTYNPKNRNGFSCDDVHRILYDSKHRLWVGGSLGLARIITVPGTDSTYFEQFLKEDGSHFKYVYGLTEDESGNIWIGTNKDLYVVKSNGIVLEFGNDDGFQESTYPLTVLKSNPQGGVYAAGMVVIEIPPEFIEDNCNIPPVYIIDFMIHQKSIRPGNESPLAKSIIYTDRIELGHDQNFISFEFAALNFEHPEKNRYRYILKGVDPDTVEAGTRNIAEYTDLKHGKYTFWVSGSNNTGLWNPQGKTIEIVIRPPWYRSGVAQSGYIIFLILAVMGYVRYRTEKLKKEKLALEQVVSERTSELRQKNEQIVEMERLKTRFFTDVSHEIRTPLSLISGPLDSLIKQEHPNPKTGNWLSMIKRNSQRLLQLVNQLLDISRLDSGRMKLVLEESDVLKHLRRLVNEYHSLAETRKIKYIVDVPESDQITWYDREKVDKITTNLLSNAFKFTPEFGTVTCRLKILENWLSGSGSDPGQKLRILVADTGPGIPSSEREKVFERFYRAEGDLYEDAGGTGIGLSLTKELIGLMHGEVALKSLEGSGAVFIVTLPLGKEHFKKDEYVLREQEKAAEETKEALIPGMTAEQSDQEKDQSLEVLIVEDNLDLRSFIGENISESYRILEAADGIEGLNQAREHIPDLIISDVMMPGMDGMELCEKLKGDERTSHIPVIMLTAKSTHKDKMEGLELGADDYLFKPFNIEELTVRIRNLLEQRERLRKKYSNMIGMDWGKMSVTTLDEEFLKKVTVKVTEHMQDFEFDVTALQDEMAMSRGHLFKKLKALTGESPSSLIRVMRLKAAASMIEKGGESITEISMNVGFSNPSYFAQCFKEQFGKSPSEYKAKSTNG